MLHLNPEAIHMAKATLFPGMDYHVATYAKYELSGVQLPKLWASLSLLQKTQNYLRHIYIAHIHPLPGVRQTVNFFTQLYLQGILDNYQEKGKTSKKAD